VLKDHQASQDCKDLLDLRELWDKLVPRVTPDHRVFKVPLVLRVNFHSYLPTFSSNVILRLRRHHPSPGPSERFEVTSILLSSTPDRYIMKRTWT